MIHTGLPISNGTRVEIRRGDHIIAGRVVWRDGGRAGLRSDDRVPLEDIVTLGRLPALKLTPDRSERRRQARLEERNRLRGRAVEFAGVVLMSLAVAAAGFSMVNVHWHDRSPQFRPLFRD